MTTDAEVGVRYAEALAAKDRDALLEVLAPDLDFMGLTPRKQWEASEPATLIDDIALARWFSPDDHIQALVAVETVEVAGRNRVDYQLRVENADGAFLVEQVAYYDVVDGRITWLRMLCSGYRPLEGA